VPFPFVAVTLPPDTPPAYVDALLEACSQAYEEGDCRAADAAAPIEEAPESRGDKPAELGASPEASSAATTVSPPPAASALKNGSESHISATISWPDELRAEISVGLPTWLENRWLEWHLDFKEQDQLVERHRALGFALGRLGVTVAQVATREQTPRTVEKRAEPPPSTPSPPATTPEANPQPTAIERTSPPLRLDPLPIPVEPEVEANTDNNLYTAAVVGGELGTGFRGVRIGGTAGIDLVFSDRFVLGVRGYLTGDAFHATFAGAEIRGGLIWEPDPLEFQLSLGAGWNYVSARADRTAFENVVGGVGSVGVALSKSAISPFVTVGASVLQEGIDTNVSGLSAYGPVVPRVQFGIKMRPSLF
jgi:hypothetical protein